LKALVERKVPFSRTGLMMVEADHYEALENGLLVRTHCAVSSWCRGHHEASTRLTTETLRLEQGVLVDFRVTVYHYGQVIGKHEFQKKLGPTRLSWDSGEMFLLKQLFGDAQFTFVVAGSGVEPKPTVFVQGIPVRTKGFPKPKALVLPKSLVIGIK
jgi:hypothetical protein